MKDLAEGLGALDIELAQFKNDSHQCLQDLIFWGGMFSKTSVPPFLRFNF
jgi:hypothetical protein